MTITPKVGAEELPSFDPHGTSCKACNDPPDQRVSDKALVDAINCEAKALERAINAALAAGLDVAFKIDASDTTRDQRWNAKEKVRLIAATAVRRIT